MWSIDNVSKYHIDQRLLDGSLQFFFLIHLHIKKQVVCEAQKICSFILTFLAFILINRTKPKQRKPYCLNKIGFLLSPVVYSPRLRAVRSRAVGRAPQSDHTGILHQRQLCKVPAPHRLLCPAAEVYISFYRYLNGKACLFHSRSVSVMALDREKCFLLNA